MAPRPHSGPGGSYDRTFIKGWEYVAGSGDLDECNGRVGGVLVDGETVRTDHHVLTQGVPDIRRCTKAGALSSFSGHL